MYEELVKALRGKASRVQLPHSERMKLMLEAADAIETMCEMVATAHDELANVIQSYEESKPHWIPVTERLPDDMEMVIGYTPCDGFMFVGYHVTSIYHDRDFSYWNIVTAMRSTKKMMKKVTHWMPLPQWPKGET